jgi:D-beta-D-heptose 7-phosphate kinase/D-beta-D-heptose 1-phosphate adenosyltransferase
MIKILVIGETCLDKFIYSEVTKVCPEAPVPVLNPIKIIQNNGMSGNVVENLKSLYPDLEIVHWSQPETITKTRYVEVKSNYMFIRVDEGEDNILPINIEYRDVEFVRNFDIVIVSDYNKGFLTDEDIIFFGKNSSLSILDSKRELNSEIIESFDFVKLNEFEMKKNKMFSNYKNIIVTMGSKGAVYENTSYPTLNPKETIDVSGAGDTFTASFILKYYETKDIPNSIVFANKMSSIVVSKRGVTTP